MPPDVRKGSAFPTMTNKECGGCAARARRSLAEVGKHLPVSRRLTAHQAAEPQSNQLAKMCRYQWIYRWVCDEKLSQSPEGTIEEATSNAFQPDGSIA